MKKLADFLYAIMAGAFIAMGGVVFLSLDNKIVGAFMFSLGLFAVCTLKYNLFTGKVGYLFCNDVKTYLPWCLMVWVGNLVGSIIVAELVRLTRVAPGIIEKSTKLVQVKADDTLISLFVLGIFCNIMVVHAVDQYLNNPHEIGKYLGIVMSIMVFILCGFEHCIADMFYIQMARMWNSQTIIALIVITLGNVLGGILIPTMRKINTKLKSE
ncbi:formate/nitrite transporter family protein [Finegoldia sp. BIOML-A2]|uniref:Formate/nitrite transporter n=1 Tax=Finegoldia magna ATCC 53516 TaxID=525282 RepID=D6S8N2_FINMA|nr:MULTISPECIES: formate/nitrite transporter family protein [Finegoldia]EFH93160.1 Formate/nitrite transporter [Finegoldia magna ATCC 53516]MCC2716767.1 formate/nitrite transporter family protein [Finegoldia magna]MDU1009699.1 formate/nitrite transporter family protein [Finegoldia magna]MDU1087629.1 formate/nitrite transporter family protein [Finegoldia magna]MDU5069973.1 formate/nitrite transporter family protein [Finegoldia magna]